MFKFKFADIGEGLTEGKVVNINIKVGDYINDGDIMFSVETEKVNADIPAPCNGLVKKINMNVGDIIYVGNVVVEIDDNDKNKVDVNVEEKNKNHINNIDHDLSIKMKQDIDNNQDNEKGAGVIGSVPISNTIIDSRELEEIDNNFNIEAPEILISPIARKMANDLKIDLSKIQGTGPGGRILKSDIQKTFDNLNKDKQNIFSNLVIDNNLNVSDFNIFDISNKITRKKISLIRKTIIKQINISKHNIPSVTLIKNIDITNLIKMKIELKNHFEKKNIKLSFMPFFIKACVMALQEFPLFNSSYEEKNDEIIYKHYYNIGIAVDTPNGLIVPVIKFVDKLNILQIAKNVNDLIDRVRNNKITIKEIQDATFTITNFGSIGVEYATPIINYPEVAILGIGAIYKQIMINKENKLEIKSILPLSLSIDHRLIDGADGGRFLIQIQEFLENPILLLV